MEDKKLFDLILPENINAIMKKAQGYQAKLISEIENLTTQKKKVVGEISDLEALLGELKEKYADIKATQDDKLKSDKDGFLKWKAKQEEDLVSISQDTRRAAQELQEKMKTVSIREKNLAEAIDGASANKDILKQYVDLFRDISKKAGAALAKIDDIQI